MIKSDAKSLARATLSSGSDILSDVLSSRNVKESTRARGREGVNSVKMRAIQRAQRYAQTGRGRSKSTKCRGKKRKASPSVTKRKPSENISSGHIWKTQVSLGKGLWIDHQPVSSVSDDGTITFVCQGTEDYTDLSKTILVVHTKVTKANGNNLDADEKVGIVNNFLHSLFNTLCDRMPIVPTWKRS